MEGNLPISKLHMHVHFQSEVSYYKAIINIQYAKELLIAPLFVIADKKQS